MTKKNPKEITVTCNSKEDRNSKLAKLCLNPNVDASIVLMSAKKDMGADIVSLIAEVKREAKKVSEGDMSAMEAMLVSQAYTLQAIFTDIIQKATSAEYISQMQSYSKMALKAQAQCRQTVAALAEIKNPKRSTFIKNQGNQQINFNSEKNKNESNELLREEHHAPMDITGEAAPSGANKKVEAVEA